MPTFTRMVSRINTESVKKLAGVGVTAHWRVTCQEDASITAYGTARLGDPDTDSFVPIELVDQETVIERVPASHWENVEAALTAEFNRKQASTASYKEF
jgi:hypothetical protein